MLHGEGNSYPHSGVENGQHKPFLKVCGICRDTRVVDAGAYAGKHQSDDKSREGRRDDGGNCTNQTQEASNLRIKNSK